MKKILVLVVLFAMLLTSCSGGVTTAEQEGTTGAGNTADTTVSVGTGGDAVETDVYDKTSALSLLEMMQQAVGDERLSVFIDPLDLSDRDGFAYHFFIEYDANIKEAAICQPMIGVIPFFLGILKVSSEKEAKEIAKEIKGNVNYQKLVCASFEKAQVVAKGTTVFLALDGDASRCDRMLSYFEALG